MGEIKISFFSNLLDYGKDIHKTLVYTRTVNWIFNIHCKIIRYRTIGFAHNNNNITSCDPAIQYTTYIKYRTEFHILDLTFGVACTHSLYRCICALCTSVQANQIL